MYADDVNIIITGKDAVEIIRNFETISTLLVNWVGLNGLALNLKKTKIHDFPPTTFRSRSGIQDKR